MNHKVTEKILNSCIQNSLSTQAIIFSPGDNVIIKLVEMIRRLLLPEYLLFSKDKMDSVQLLDQIDKLEKTLMDVLDVLYAEKDMQQHVQTVDLFLRSLPSLRKLSLADLQAAYEGDPAAESYEEIVFTYPGFFSTNIYRAAHRLYCLGVPLLPRMMSEYAHSKTGIDIHPGARIGQAFFIDHGTGVVIGETTKIGKKVKLYQGVTLGALSTRGGQTLKKVKRHPTLSDYVTVYAGASILGGDTVIGKNAVIGCNAYITLSVEDGMKISSELRGKSNEK